MNIIKKIVWGMGLMVLVMFCSCAKEEILPTYQGMVITEKSAFQTSNLTEQEDYSGFSSDLFYNDDKDIDQEDPFANFDGETILDEIKKYIQINDNIRYSYYSAENTDLLLIVKLYNPNQYDILSVTINGITYQSYQLEKESDPENLILSINSKESGIKEYRIDAIKYADGKKLRDIEIPKNNKIKLAVRYSRAPVAQASNLSINATSFSFDITISDFDKLIEKSGDIIKAYLYDGKDLLQERNLHVGENTVVFDQLKANTLYQYAVVSVFDLNEGEGERLEILSKRALYTDSIVKIIEILPGFDNVRFDFEINDADGLGSINKIELFKADQIVSSLTDFNVREFTQLASDTEYTVKISYAYGEYEEIITQSFHTYKQAPDVSFTVTETNQNRIGFAIAVLDPDAVFEFSKTEIFQGNTLIQTRTALSEHEFLSLLSDTEYRIKITYFYDVNDGIGKQRYEKEITASTTKNTVPTISISETAATYSSIGFELSETDPDQVGAVRKIELFQGDSLIATLANLESRIFTGLNSDTEYILKVTYCYDLNDGTDEKEITQTKVIKTKQKTTPSLSILIPAVSKASVDYEVQVTDPDSVGEIRSIELYLGDSLIFSEERSSGNFVNLLSNTLYTIKAIYGYDLNDGMGIKEIVSEENFVTEANAIPDLEFSLTGVTDKSIAYEIMLTDIDQVGYESKIELYLEEEILETADFDTENKHFLSLYSDTLYRIMITYWYNLKDGNGNTSLVIEKEVRTAKKIIPSFSVTEVEATPTAITFSCTSEDPDNIGSITMLSLFYNEEEIAELDSSLPSPLQFTGLTPNTEYRIVAVYQYDLNDRTGRQEIILEYRQATLATEVTIQSMQVLNTTSPKVGEEIHLRLILVNPCEIAISFFTVNGKEAQVVGGDSQYSPIIKFVPETEGGDYPIIIDAINYYSFGKIVHQNLSSTYESSVLILGNISVLGISNETKVIGLAEDSLVQIALDNPTGYEISEVVLGFDGSYLTYSKDEINTINDNLIQIPFKGTLSEYDALFHQISVESITYGNVGDYTEKSISGIYSAFAILHSTSERTIHSIEDLKTIENGYLYKLTADIDLIEEIWIPFDFIGILDGNGYSIKNMSIVIQNESVLDQYYGLFSKFNGILCNLQCIDVYISVKSLGNLFVGGLIGYSDSSVVYNNKITGVIHLNTVKNGYSDGVVGYQYETILYDNEMNAQVML